MRRSGFVEAVDGLGSHDHLCWAFDSPREYRSAAGRFLADGLAAGQRVVFVGDPVDESDTHTRRPPSGPWPTASAACGSPPT